jgi:GAF domain-containing protein
MSAHAIGLVNVQQVLDDLLLRSGASRCTLRQNVAGADFPVTYEALAPGVRSIKDIVSVRQVGSPTFNRVLQTKERVIQDDCRASVESDPDNNVPEFREMLDVYGDLASFIVEPLFVGDLLFGVISLHQLGNPRKWADSDIQLVSDAGNDVCRLLAERLHGK